MRANIVSEAVRDERGQEGEKRVEREKVNHCWPCRRNMFVLGGTMCGKKIENKLTHTMRGTNSLDQSKTNWQINNLFSNLNRERTQHALNKSSRGTQRYLRHGTTEHHHFCAIIKGMSRSVEL